MQRVEERMRLEKSLLGEGMGEGRNRGDGKGEGYEKGKGWMGRVWGMRRGRGGIGEGRGRGGDEEGTGRGRGWRRAGGEDRKGEG
jgi:hypothetical protein